jgi:hypothetical protein
MSNSLSVALLLLAVFVEAREFSVPPGETRSIYVESGEDWRLSSTMRVSVFGTGSGRFCAMLVDKNGFWFQSKRSATLTDDKGELALSLQGPRDWEAHRDLRRPFGRDTLRWIQRWGIKVTNSGERTLTGTVALDLQRGDAAKLGPSRLQYPSSGIAGEMAEFSIEHLPFTPDPDKRLTLHWKSAQSAGEAVFFPMQRFTQLRRPFGDARMSPLGRSVWAARWRPPDVGSYTLSLRLNSQAYSVGGPLRPFEVAAGQAAPVQAEAKADGFLAQSSHAAWKWQDDDWQPTSAAMPCWYAQLEWTSDWGHYLGAGEYNQHLASRFERVLARSQTSKPILLFSDDELDHEGTFNWAETPLNAANGGPLSDPGQFYRSEAAMASVLARAQYIVSRYGSFPAARGLLIDLQHPATFGPDWARRLAARLSIQCPGTPVFCSSPRLLPPAWQMPLSLGVAWQPALHLGSDTTEISSDGDGSMQVRCAGPGVAAIIGKRVEHLAKASTLSFTVDPQGQFAHALRVMVVLKSEDGQICQSPLLRLRGDFSHRFELPLDDLSYWVDEQGQPALTSRRELAAMQELAFRFFCEPAPSIALSLGNIELQGPGANPPSILGPFDTPWDQQLFGRSYGDWRKLSEQTKGCWNPILDWSPRYGESLHAGIVTEFQRALDAYTGSPMPLLLFSEDELDSDGLYNWQDHPLNAQNGGSLTHAQDFYEGQAGLNAILGRAGLLLQNFGSLPAVDGLLIDLRYRHEGSGAWAERLAKRLSEAYPGIRLLCNSPGLQKRVANQDITIAKGWQLEPSLCVAAAAHNSPDAVVRRADADSANLLTQGMAVAAMTQTDVLHWAHAKAFSCVVTPSASCEDMRLTAVLRTDDGLLFESPLLTTYGDYPHRMDFPLVPDFWVPLNGDRPLIPELDLLNVHQVVLRFFNLPPGDARIAVSDTGLLGPLRADSPGRRDLKISGLNGDEAVCEQYQRFELDFQLSRSFRNPYDPDEIKVDLSVTDPDGEEIVQPGFYWEEWTLRLEDDVERVTKGQASAWKVRLTPQKPGRYKWTLSAKTQAGTARRSGTFRCNPSESRGFVRISARDPRCFEFSNGEFFYPIGHNLRSPSDRREGAYSPDVLDNCSWAERAGTFAFETWFQRMAANGENFARTWMTAWWLGIEWTPAYPGYHGLGFYNQGNAQRVDRILELAETHGIYLNLELGNHGAISSKVDSEWKQNPLNSKRSGGFLKRPADALKSERAQALLKQRLRYVAARWGYSPAIAFWGTVTEAEWADAYGANRSAYGRWLDGYGELIQDLNAAHPQAVTSHFSYPGRAGSIWSKDHLQITHTNAYDSMHQTYWKRDLFGRGRGIADRLFVYGKGLESYSQPLLVGEWGGNHLRNRTSHLNAELRTGLWASYMTNASGATGFWWWNLVDHKKLYGRFKALSNFAKGEDRRGKRYRSERARLIIKVADDDSGARGISLFNASELFAYAYTESVNRYKDSVLASSRTDERLPLVEKSSLLLPDTIENGDYKVEYWDTFTGKVISAKTVKVSDDRRTVDLLPFSADLALKLKKR